MDSLAPITEISQRDFYRQRAAATRSRRQAAGRYAKPTKAQIAAFAKSLERDGRKRLTADECDLLSAHPYLLPSQRAEYATMAAERSAMPVVADLSDGDQWIVAITNGIEALPVTLADVTDPYMVGWVDAEDGKPCEPLEHYILLGEIESYIIGWKESAAAMEKALAA